MPKLEIFIGYMGLIPQYHYLDVPEKIPVILPLDMKVSKHIQDHIATRKYVVNSFKKALIIPQKRFTQKIHKSERT